MQCVLHRVRAANPRRTRLDRFNRSSVQQFKVGTLKKSSNRFNSSNRSRRSTNRSVAGSGEFNSAVHRAPAHCLIWTSTLPRNLPLRYGAAEPILETGRADARVIPRRQGLIVHVYAEVLSMDVCDYLTRILLGAQEPPDQLVQA